MDSAARPSVVRADQSAPPARSTVIFRHNGLHDMESTLWMAIDFLINMERTMAVEDAASSSIVQVDISPAGDDRKYARSLFYGKAERMAFMTKMGGQLERVMDNLPESIRFIGTELLGLRELLIRQYMEIEAQGPPDPRTACTPEVYTVFVQTFWAIADGLEGKDVTVSPLKPSADQFGLLSNHARKEYRTSDAVAANASVHGKGASSSTSGKKRSSAQSTGAGGSKKRRL